MKFHVLVISGGIGSRYGSNIPKQYTKSFDGKTIIYHSVKPFSSFCQKISSVTFVCDENWISFIKKIPFGIDAPIYFANSGASREDSIYNGLKAIEKNLGEFDANDFVILQEAVRPFVSESIIEELIELDPQFTCVASTVNPMVMYAKFDYEKLEAYDLFDKSKIVELMLPKRYQARMLVDLFDEYNANSEGKLPILDESELFLRKGIRIKCVKGDFRNIKITIPVHRYVMDGIIRSKKTQK